MPVMTPQASSATASGGMSSGSGDDLALVHDDRLGEGAAIHRLHDRVPSWRRQRRARAPGVAQSVGLPLAQGGQVPQARIRVTTTRSPMATPSTPSPERGDAARGLVAVDGRQVAAPGAVGEGDVGMADRHGLERDLDLARPRGAQLELLDLQRGADRRAQTAARDAGHVCLPLLRAVRHSPGARGTAVGAEASHGGRFTTGGRIGRGGTDAQVRGARGRKTTGQRDEASDSRKGAPGK